MSAALPTAEACCLPACDSVLVQNIPGPAGEDGTDGAAGTDGISSVTTLAVAFTMPAELDEDVATVGSTAGFVIGENVFVQGLGTLQITAIGSSVLMTLKNLEDAATSAYASNAAPGAIAAIGSRVGMTGLQGQTGIITGLVAGTQIKGTYPGSILLAIPNALGALAVGNGTDANSLSAGTNGQLPAYDNTQPLGLLPKSIIPVTGDANVAADRLTRLSSATGTPIALTASKASLKDPGGLGVLLADATTGNARGTDSVDLQVSRPTVGATAVASGSQSVIGGGQDNTASGLRSVVVGGEKNLASGSETFIGAGDSNQVDSTQSAIVAGDTNTITGGAANEAFIGGGRLNAITGGGQSVIAGGLSNAVSSQYGSILGGLTNVVSGEAASIQGGREASADKYGQRAFSAGRFAAQADCQQSDLLWRIETTGIVAATEMFLNGTSLRATIASGRTVAFDILITARSSAGLNAAWTIKGVINNLAGVTSIATAVVNALIADNSGATFGTLANVPVVSADNANDALVIHVANPAATNVRWTAHGRLVEIGY